MCSNCKIIVVLSLLFTMFAMGLANAQTSSKLNTPALMDQYKPFADYPEGYQAVGLTDILYRSCPARGLELSINVYWQAVKAASDWKYFRQRAEKVNRFDPQNNAIVKLFLQKTEDKAAMAHLKMRRYAIELNAMAGDCGFSPIALPYCNELPHFGNYITNIDKIAQVRSVSGEMRMLAKRIDLGYEQIKASAAALAAAIYYLEAQTELYSAGNSAVTDVINAFEQEETTRETFWQAILSYNRDIARYVVWSQAGEVYNPKQLAPLLLLNPRPATVFETTQNSNPKSLLDQRPNTYDDSSTGSAPDPAYPADVNPSDAVSQPDTQLQPSDQNVNPLPTEPSYTPIIQNDSLRAPKIYQVAYTPSGELTTPNWFDVSVYKPAGATAVTLKEYLRNFSPVYYQQATNQYWRASAQCQKLAVIITARRRAEEVQQKVYARLSAQENSAQSSLFLLAMNVWKQTLAAEAIETQKAILREQFGMNQLLSMAGAYASQELWPVTPFHTETYQIVGDVPGLENDLTVKSLAGSINQEYSLMTQTRSALEQASAVVERDAASETATFKDIITELQTEFYFATAFVNQTAEYNFSIGNYVQRWMYARKSPLSLDDFCESIVSQMQ
ncbi:MAG: hypothetical protein IJF84_11815 [Thermoguttaceae bacterium]|nr:hypothetical protein [Thermoguttaceae bacterium]